ncbi:MAG: DsbE family thiol:disulfide interchange protein [Alphaproteobacteria bacterium]
MRRLLFLIPVIAFVALAAIFSTRLDGTRDPSLLPSVLIDKPAPVFNLPALTGQQDIPGIATADLTGQVTIVNIFASWCVPCLAEHPLISRLAEDGVTIFGINYRDKDPAALRWLAKHGNPYTRIGADRDARASLEWGVTGVPETFILDATGRIRHKYSGPLTPAIIEQELLPILAELTQ